MANKNYLNEYAQFKIKIKKWARTKQLLVEKIQLTFLYFFAVILLVYNTKENLGYFPEVLVQFIPYLFIITKWKFLRLFTNTESLFLIYFFICEALVHTSRDALSIVVKFNILLLLLLEILQNLLYNCWGVINNKNLELVYGKIGNKMALAAKLFYCAVFIVSLGVYGYCYKKAMLREYPIFPGRLHWIVKSAGWWLRIRVPGNSKRSDQKNKKKQK